MVNDNAAASGQRQGLNVVVNGKAVATDMTNLAALLDEAGFADARVATALNGDFVPARDRSAALLRDGDRIEIVSARQGG